LYLSQDAAQMRYADFSPDTGFFFFAESSYNSCPACHVPDGSTESFSPTLPIVSLLPVYFTAPGLRFLFLSLSPRPIDSLLESMRVPCPTPPPPPNTPPRGAPFLPFCDLLPTIGQLRSFLFLCAPTNRSVSASLDLLRLRPAHLPQIKRLPVLSSPLTPGVVR